MKLNNLKIGKLDRYIIGKFIGTYLFTIAMLVVVVIIFDVTEKIDDFMELNAPISEIAFTYYLNFIPFFINQFSGLITFIAVIFFTSKMAYDTEIIAILSGGVSFKRLMYPFFLSAMMIASLSLTLYLFIIPVANVNRMDFESKYLKKSLRGNYEDHIYRQISPGEYIYLNGYSLKGKKAQFMVLETHKDNQIIASLSARNATFDSRTKHWKADRYIERHTVNGLDSIVKKEKLDTLINLSDTEIGKVENYIQTLNIIQLNNFIDEQTRKGSDMTISFEVEKHNRYAYPIATFILTLIGVSLSSRKVRGGTGLHIGIGLALCFSYILFMKFADEFAKSGVVAPSIAIWMPNIVYLFIGLYLYHKAPK